MFRLIVKSRSRSFFPYESVKTGTLTIEDVLRIKISVRFTFEVVVNVVVGTVGNGTVV